MASTTEDKLRMALASKEAIRSAIEQKGVQCGTDVPLSGYSQKILQIGGGGPGSVTYGKVEIYTPVFGHALEFEGTGKFEEENRDPQIIE